MTQLLVHDVLTEAAGEAPPVPPAADIERRGRRQRRNTRLLQSGGAGLVVVLVAVALQLGGADDGRVRTIAPIGAPEVETPSQVSETAKASGSGPTTRARTSDVSIPTVPTSVPPVTVLPSRPDDPPTFTPPPPGTRLYFVSQSKLVSTRLDGTDGRVVVDRYLGWPGAISDDGTRMLLFTWNSGDGSHGISILDLVTGARRVVVQVDSNDIDGADLSADGTRIVYALHRKDVTPNLSSSPAPYDVHIVNVDGTGDHVIARGTQPAWSPDGNRIYLSWCQDDGSGGPCTIRSDGTDRRMLPFNFPISPVTWSPDGQWIAGSGPDNKVSIARPDGSDLRAVGREMFPGRPAWTPDSRRVVYKRAGDGTYDIAGNCTGHCAPYGLVSTAIDGSGEVHLTHDSNDGAPVIARGSR